MFEIKSGKTAAGSEQEHNWMVGSRVEKKKTGVCAGIANRGNHQSEAEINPYKRNSPAVHPVENCGK